MFTNMGIAKKKIFFNRIIMFLTHCKQKFQNPLTASVNRQKGQEELPDILVVVTLPNRALMLSTGPRLSLNKEMLLLWLPMPLSV